MTADRRTTLKSPSGTMSPAEAISVVTNGIALAAHFGDGVLRPADVAAGIVGAVIKDPVTDARRVGRVPGSRGPGAAGLGGLLPGLPRGERVTRLSRGGQPSAGREQPGRPGGGARHPASRAGFGPLGAGRTGPAAAGHGADRGARGRGAGAGAGRRPGHDPAGGPAGLRPDAPRVSAFWPYAVFSPEWQALHWAAGHRCRSGSATCPPPVLAGRTPGPAGRTTAEPDGTSRRAAADDAEPGERARR